ncbi:MAG TPA: ATP-binding protein [Polyangiaceae bacterium]|nr:ATP-binding protein [Polyangiaceae bacterium]
MSQGVATVSLAWASVYSGLASFFFIVAPRFAGRGYALLGGAMACVSVASLGLWGTFAYGASPFGLLCGRVLMLGATLAPVFNTHFVVRFTRHPFERAARWGYGIAAGLLLVDLASALSVLGRAESLHAPVEVISPWAPWALVVSLVFGLHLALAGLMLGVAVRRGMTAARWPFALLVLLGPLVVFDYSRVLAGNNYYITESLTWIYGLVIVASLLSELRGAEGLLASATSSLAARTAELQSSYAELDFVHTELMRKEQLAAVGELAASIAHEVRNPLAIIMNAASGLRRKTISDADKETLLSIVDEESARLNQLVTELLRFARPVSAAPTPVSLLDICEQVRAAAPPNYRILVHVTRTGEVDRALVDPGLFRLALDNLIANAMQAMPSGGDIELSIGRGQLADGTEAASLEIRDHGQGMTQPDLERARKPFFTTRPRGTGLGLPIVDRILEAHGGEVALESSPGRGTVVTLRVPLEIEAATGRIGSKSPGRRRMRSFSDASSEPPSSQGSERDSPPPPLEAPPPPSFRGS